MRAGHPPPRVPRPPPQGARRRALPTPTAGASILTSAASNGARPRASEARRYGWSDYLEPPVCYECLEEFLDFQWGERAGRTRLLAANDDLRDRVALRLLLGYGRRKGSLQGIQYHHFDHQRRRLTLVVAKGSKVRELPIPDRYLWLDFERLILEVEAQPHHYLLWGSRRSRTAVPTSTAGGR